MSVSVLLAPTPILQFFNNAGQPNAGGSVLTQVGGVNYPTYEDSGGTTALPNPIPLNSRGEISNASGVSKQLFLETGTTYTFTLYDADNNQLNQASYVIENNAATEINYNEGSANAVTRTVTSKLQEIFSVKDFGAVGDGVNDDTTAIINAIAAASALRKEFSGTFALLSSPTVYFPYGIYLISSALSADTNGSIDYINLVGEDSIITTSSSITIIGGIGSETYITGLQFEGGNVALSIKTNNVDTTRIIFYKCSFVSQATNAIQVDTTSNSSLIKISSCFGYNLLGSAQFLNAGSGDQITIEDTWVEWSVTSKAVFQASSNLHLRGMFGVPTGIYAWVEIDSGGSLKISSGTRFGGESIPTFAGIIWKSSGDWTGAAPIGIIFKDSYIDIAGSVPLIYFYNLPNQISIKNLVGIQGNTAENFFFDSSIPTADLAGALNKSIFAINIDNNIFTAIYFNSVTSTLLAAALDFEITTYQDPPSSPRLHIADLVLQVAGWDSGFYSSSQTVTLTSSSDEFGVPERVLTATADGQYGQIYGSSALSGFSAGMYTLVLDVEASANDSFVILSIQSSGQKPFPLISGRRTICFPFYYDGGTNENLGLSVYNFKNGAILKFQRLRLFSGVCKIMDKNTILYDTAPPTAGNWFVGDIIYNTVPAASGSMGWVCVTAGTPGTWKTFGAISA